MNKPHILITGGAGFIGSHLVDKMLASNFEVSVIDCMLPQVHANAPMDDDGWPIYLNKGARRIRGHLLQPGLFEASLKGVTHLAHLAASVGVGQSMTNIIEYTQNNTMVAAVMLEELSKGRHTVQRMAVASSMSIYGEGEYQNSQTGQSVAPDLRPKSQLAQRQWELLSHGQPLEPMPTSESKPLHPASIYAINKRDHEEMFLTVGRSLGIPTMAMRLFNVYGSRQALSNPYTGVAAIFISRLLNDQPPLVFEDGEQRRDFVHVLDVANAFATVLKSDKEVYDAYNVGSGASVSVKEVALTLARLLGKDIAPQILNKFRFGDIRHCFANISKLKDVFGVYPERNFAQGMLELIEWVKTVQKPLDGSGRLIEQQSMSKLVV